MKTLTYLEGTQCPQVTDEQIEEFKISTGISELSATFILYCKSQNGGVPAACNEYLIPTAAFTDYWELCGDRVINPGGELDISKLLGINESPRYSISHWTENARTIWGLASSFFCIAYDGIGSKIVSRLLEGDDEVYLWEPHVDPHFFLISETLAEFYDSLGPALEHD